MFKRKEAEVISAPVSVETYAVSNGAARIRTLEAELVATFEEWYSAQQASVERSVHVEFAMTPWLGAAWSVWKADRFSKKETA